MYQVFNCVTGEAMPVLAESPYELAGPLAERRQEQKRDEEGKLLYLKQIPNPAIGENEITGWDTPSFVDVETTETGVDVTVEYDDDGNPIATEFMPYQPVMIDGGPLYEWREVVPTDAELLNQAKQSKLWQIQNELDQLDKYLPRGLEDFWAATEYDVTNLPQVQRDRLARKVALRAAYTAVGVAATVAEVEAVNVV